MKLTGWHVESDGAVSRTTDLLVAGTVKDVAISDGQAFVTAVRKNNDQLQVSSWTTTNQAGAFNYQAAATLGDVSKVAVAKLAGSGVITGRAVTAVRNSFGYLQLNVWDFDNAANTLTSRDSFVLGPITEVAVRTLRYGSNLSSTTRFVTAVRNGYQKLQADLWEVSHTGQITRLGGATTTDGVSNSAGSQQKIALGEWGSEDFFVAFIKDDGALQLVSWKTNNAGDVYGPKFDSKGAITEVAVTGTTTVVRKADGNLQLIQWSIDSDGDISSKGSADARSTPHSSVNR